MAWVDWSESATADEGSLQSFGGLRLLPPSLYAVLSLESIIATLKKGTTVSRGA